ncbi:MAG: SCO family protein [Saprospiraceae bacterium]|jgi:protein SCO1/2|nr:SCO family protein [Saprospiraceae bacterium]
MSKKFVLIFGIGFCFLSLISCNGSGDDKLPVYGEINVEDGDSIFHSIRDFSFINQDSQVVNNASFEDKIYISDFFFTSCPTICPKVKKQMLRIYEAFETEPRLEFISHSIDSKRDSVPVLKAYAEKINISSDRWHLVTGDSKAIYDIAKDYFSIAVEDPNAPGGYDHSGYIILVDKDRHIRAYCDGTNEEEVDEFMEKIKKLLAEMDKK